MAQRFLNSIEDEVAAIRAQGFATSPLIFEGEAAIAAPILGPTTVHGALSLRYIASSKSAAEMANAFLAPLQEIAHAIGETIAASARAD